MHYVVAARSALSRYQSSTITSMYLPWPQELLPSPPLSAHGEVERMAKRLARAQLLLPNREVVFADHVPS
jgi:hypothetical protein